MAGPEASPLGGAGASRGGGRGLAEDPGLGAAAGSSPLSLSRLLSTLSARRRGPRCSGGGSPAAALPVLPPRRKPAFARHGSTHCGRPAFRSQECILSCSCCSACQCLLYEFERHIGRLDTEGAGQNKDLQAATWQDSGGPNHCGHDVRWHERHEGISI